MTENAPDDYCDAITRPFWEAARRHVLLVQSCRSCGHRQFYPRVFCLACQSLDLGWIEAAGGATTYSVVTVRLQTLPDLHPPYQLALVDLDEGVRMLTNIIGPPCVIGDRVQLAWRARADAPPLPVFTKAS